jgi:ABC-type branched-subunit amino acid transport system ATPase component
MNIIESAGLGKRYRRTWALRDCTLAVPDGHLVALVGPNGAGKTTLLHMAVGLVSPTAGAVRVLGHQPAGVAGRAGRHRVRGAERAAVPEPAGRGHAAGGPQPEPAVGSAAGRGPAG